MALHLHRTASLSIVLSSKSCRSSVTSRRFFLLFDVRTLCGKILPPVKPLFTDSTTHRGALHIVDQEGADIEYRLKVRITIEEHICVDGLGTAVYMQSVWIDKCVDGLNALCGGNIMPHSQRLLRRFDKPVRECMALELTNAKRQHRRILHNFLTRRRANCTQETGPRKTENHPRTAHCRLGGCDGACTRSTSSRLVQLGESGDNGDRCDKPAVSVLLANAWRNST